MKKVGQALECPSLGSTGLPLVLDLTNYARFGAFLTQNSAKIYSFFTVKSFPVHNIPAFNSNVLFFIHIPAFTARFSTPTTCFQQLTGIARQIF
jgi:hypothetical protein